MFCLRDVYVWEVPVRLTHWVNVVCLITLSFTGYYIGNPYINNVHPFFYGVLKDQWVMGWMRFIHFSTAYVFAMSVLLRIYWGFSGNRYARWCCHDPSFETAVQGTLAGHPLLPAPRTQRPRRSSVTPRPPALAYIVLFLGYLVSILTGFALMSQSHVGLFWKAVGGWILPHFPVQWVRLVHHTMMWFLIVFPNHPPVRRMDDRRRGRELRDEFDLQRPQDLPGPP